MNNSGYSKAINHMWISQKVSTSNLPLIPHTHYSEGLLVFKQKLSRVIAEYASRKVGVISDGFYYSFNRYSLTVFLPSGSHADCN